MEPVTAQLSPEPAWTPFDPSQPGLFQRLRLSPGYTYDLGSFDMQGAIGITHDTHRAECSHIWVRLFQGAARVFNPRYRGTDHHLVHGFGVINPMGENPHDEEWLVGHSTWEGAITSKRRINHLSNLDQGTRVWICTHEGVRFWTKRVFELMCFQRGREIPADRERPKFSTYAGATLGFRRPQMQHHNDVTLGRIAAAVADVLVGEQIHTRTGGHVRHFTCLGLVSFALQSAMIISILNPQEREELRGLQDRAMRANRIMQIMRNEEHPLGKFMSADTIGLQNTRFAWPSVLARALDEHSVAVDLSNKATALPEEKKDCSTCA